MNFLNFTPEPVAAAAAATGLLIALVVWAVWRRNKARHRRDLEELRASINRHQMLCLEMFSEVNRSLGSLEDSVRIVREAPKPGGLSRSSRSQALQLLRSGQSPDTAAASLGVGRRELQLLERVSGTLCGR